MRIERASTLDKVRAEARRRIDGYFAMQTPERNPHLLAAHQRKLALAVTYLKEVEAFQNAGGKGKPPSPPTLLAEESGLRGLHVVALCQLIVERASASGAALDLLERDRQRAEHAIRKAETAGDVESIVQGFGLQLTA